MSDEKTLYKEDFLAWSKEQAAALRSAAHGGSNQKLDWQSRRSGLILALVSCTLTRHRVTALLAI